MLTIHLISPNELATYEARLQHYFAEQVKVPDMQARIKEVCALALDDQQQVVGVATKYRQYNPRFKSEFWYYRSSVAPAFRQQACSRRILQAVFDSLNASYQLGDPIGLFYEVENKEIIQALPKVKWNSGALFMGYDELGRQLRCLYFDRAEITS